MVSIFKLDLFCQAVVIKILESNQVTIANSAKESGRSNACIICVLKISQATRRDNDPEYADLSTQSITPRVRGIFIRPRKALFIIARYFLPG